MVSSVCRLLGRDGATAGVPAGCVRLGAPGRQAPGRSRCLAASGRRRRPPARSRSRTKPTSVVQTSARRQARDAEEGRQHALDRPGLAADLGDEPAELGGDPGQRQATRRRSAGTSVRVEPAQRRRAQKRTANRAMKKKPSPTMTRKTRTAAAHPAPCPTRPARSAAASASARIGDVALQQQRIAEIVAWCARRPARAATSFGSALQLLAARHRRRGRC